MARPIAAAESLAPLPFPLKGLDVMARLEAQPPGTTPHGQNVRAFEALTQRGRGGSRPGLEKHIASTVSGVHHIQELMTIVSHG